VAAVPYLVMHTQQSSRLIARMHHNSQKRINTSKLLLVTSLSRSRTRKILQRHPSSFAFTTLLNQQNRGPQAPGSYLCHVLTSVLTSVAFASADALMSRPHSSSGLSATLHKRLSYISSSIINGDEAYWMSSS